MIPIVIQISNKYESIPDRSMRLIHGCPSIVFLIDRLQLSGYDQIVLSTSNDTVDDALESIAKDRNVQVVRNNYEDVINRLILAADLLNTNHIVRVFGNSPLIDIEELERLYKEHKEGDFDYSYNEHQNGIIWGMGCDVFKVSALMEMNHTIKNTIQRETLSFYIQQNSEKYAVNKSYVLENRPAYRLNLETERDLNLLKEICNNISHICSRTVIDYLESHKILEDYNVENPPQEVGTEKLFQHMEKVQDIIANKGMASTYPISVELTLTNACNLKCVYCSDQHLRDKQGSDNMGFETFTKLFRDLRSGGTKGVVFEGGGEPTLHPDFDSLVNCAWKEGLAVGLITNGTKRIAPEILEKFEWIRVSLDASNKEEYIELKKVDRFEAVIANLAEYTNHCKTVGVGYVVTSNNMSNIESLILRLRELGVSYIQLRPVVDAPDLSPQETTLNYLKMYRRENFNVIIDGMKENAQNGNAQLPCYASSLTSVISGDGSVYICGRLNIYDWIKPIGNIQTQSFDEIWYGEERKNQLQMITDRNFCESNCPQCRITKYNKLFNRLFQTQSIHFI